MTKPKNNNVSKLAQLHPRRFFLETWAEVDENAKRARREREEAGLGYDWRPMIVLSVGALMLVALEYLGSSRDFYAFVNARADHSEFFRRFQDPEWQLLYGKSWWAGVRFLAYFVVPACIIKFALKERVVDHGLSFKNFREHAWMYFLAYLVVFVCVVAVSFDEGFQRHYPMYPNAGRSWSDYLIWTGLYGLQFFSLEFFFRGHWLKALEPTMGSYSILAMTVPYCMIHFGKPWGETVGAIIAGIVLGTLAYKSRSIWAGFLVHVSVAVTMDMAAMLQTTGLPDRWAP